MSSTAQNSKRENSYPRSRTNNSSQNIRQEWVPRGSAVPVLPRSIDNSTSNEDENGGPAVTNRPVEPIISYSDRIATVSRGKIPHSVSQSEKEEKRNYTRLNKNKGFNAVNMPQLVQEIQDKLLKGSVECMICYEMVKRSSPIWSCSSCYSIFHLGCIKKWARAPTSVDLLAEKNQGSNWRCPGCQHVQLISAKEIRYMCFCGKRQDPPSDLYLTPHSCGEPCGKALEKDPPGDGLVIEDMCPHLCVLQCHPGPCPPCKAFAPPRSCPCGKKTITTRCSDRRNALTCGQRCDKFLSCGRHTCKRACHIGPCDACQDLIVASCFCKKKTEVVLCRNMDFKGEFKSEAGVFSCGSVCDNKLECGNHVCCEVCHPGSCGVCDLLPGNIKTCCCGKTALSKERKTCLDPIPTCTQTCGKILPCGLHHCPEVCHIGDCPPCNALVTQECRCRSTSRTVECFRTLSEAESFTCDKPCEKKKSCGRHRCSERCCPKSIPNNASLIDWDAHLCTIPCGKKLRCGQHSCQSLCHSGHCPPCLETIFTDLTCACGRTSIPPPLPCGTQPPSCQFPCSFPQSCGHPSSHTCHFGSCPPCSMPVSKECVGGHVVLHNMPCGSKYIRCNKLCGKTRQCGLHACSRTCHEPPCDASDESSSISQSSCGQVCGAPRKDCRHTCTTLCHPSAPCPDVRCEFPVTITCNCGRISASVPCDAGANSANPDAVREASIIQRLPVSLVLLEGNGQRIPLGQRKLMCDDECGRVERKKVLADAFGVNPPSLDALHFGENAASLPEVLSDLLRRDSKWVLSIEERCRYLVVGRGRGGVSAPKVHVFCVMQKEKRDAVRLIAERWKLSVNAAGWEPKRFVVVHVNSKSRAPARVLGMKSGTPSTILQPPIYDPMVDMDPRLVVALYDMPSDSDISALVLRFGGECELVWLNDRNALAVFSDPARAATAMRRLDQGSVYYGAVTVSQPSSSSAAAGTTAWGSTASSKEVVAGSAWKKATVHDSAWKDGSLSAEEWSQNTSASVWKESPTAAPVNQWSVLQSRNSSVSSSSGSDIRNTLKQASNPYAPLQKEDTKSEADDTFDDWEKAYD